MSSAAVVTMASEPASGQPKRLHPLFSSLKAGSMQQSTGEPQDAGLESNRAPEQPIRAAEQPMDWAATPPSSAEAAVSFEPVDLVELPVEPAESISNTGEKRRKPDAAAEDASMNSASQGSRKRARSSKRQKSSLASVDIANHFVRKGDSKSEAAEQTARTDALAPAHDMPQKEPDVSAPPPSRPKRVLQYNPKTGTIGSPPRPKVPTAVVVIKYGQAGDDERARINSRIQEVLTGKTRIFSPPKQEGPKRRGRPPKKAAHPFFTGGLGQKMPVTPSSSPGPSSSTAPKPSMTAHAGKYYTSTPCSPKPLRIKDAFGDFSAAASRPPAFRMPQFGGSNGILRVPGACYPQWPWKGTSHVHPPAETTVADQPFKNSPPLPLRKCKGQTVQISADESLLERSMRSLYLSDVVDELRHTDSEDLQPPPARLRLPLKHLVSGRKVQAHVAGQLQTGHAGLRGLYDSLQTTLSAFDQHQCETQSWAQKYAPTCAEEVLQSGREPQILRDWLAALKVESVDTGEATRESRDVGGTGGTGGTRDAGVGGKGGGKAVKKRKKNKLDGFIVSSDEEDELMQEAGGGGGGGVDGAEGEPSDWLANGLYGMQRKTVVRPSVGGEGRLTNAIVLSGPHGCGKTAAVYAVAKELDFEVFEINASTRRSGKDVLDRIGDMTRNHLVQHRRGGGAGGAGGAGGEGGEGEEDGSEGGSKERSAGESKQAKMMTSFFQAKPKVKAQAPVTSNGSSSSNSHSNGNGNNSNGGASGKTSQKQSLILLEEADILYEEDRQFWTTVVGLMTQSKRPFVITCNSELQLPLATLQLHGILRLSAAPAAAAVDRLLLAAASEGHLLQRPAVAALYTARGQDMRAALADLQFWCQLGVGDRRGGFEWFVQRWPDGVDRDEEQQIVRVVSEGTYLAGMGWVVEEDKGGTEGTEGTEGKKNKKGSGSNTTEKEDSDELVMQAWREWELDASGLLGTQTGPLPANGPASSFSRDALFAYADEADAASDADFVAQQTWATGLAVSLDPALPPLPSRARDDFVLGSQPLVERIEAMHSGGSFDLRLPLATAMLRLASHGGKSHVTESDVVAAIVRQHSTVPASSRLSRIDFALAFDPIAVAASAFGDFGAAPTSHLDPSVFDRNMEPIVTDVAPFVRSIVAYDGRLQLQRQRLSRFISTHPHAFAAGAATAAAPFLEGDKITDEGAYGQASAMPASLPAPPPLPPKRMRTTRAALSALEGVPRSVTRRQRWFVADINPVLVARTAGPGWEEAAQADVARQAEEGLARMARQAELARQAEAEAEAEAERARLSMASQVAAGQVAGHAAIGPAMQQLPLQASPGVVAGLPRGRNIVMSSPGGRDGREGSDEAMVMGEIE